MSPLHRACYLEQVEVARNLIQTGADVYEKNRNRETPLMIAVCFGHAKMARFLVQSGASLAQIIHGEVVVMQRAAKEWVKFDDYSFLLHPTLWSFLVNWTLVMSCYTVTGLASGSRNRFCVYEMLWIFDFIVEEISRTVNSTWPCRKMTEFTKIKCIKGVVASVGRIFAARNVITLRSRIVPRQIKH